MINKIDSFESIAPTTFKTLVDNYGYILEEIKIYNYSNQKWSIKLIYINKEKNLKIEIEQAPYYTDYGFSFVVSKIGTEEFNILYNVPLEKQDSENTFLIKAYGDLFSTDETLNIISGKYWKKLNKIVFQV